METHTPAPRAWDDISGVASKDPLRRFEDAWKGSPPSRRPDPDAFVTDGSPAVRLALFRADLGFRWDSGERPGIEIYQGRGLPEDALIALAYEEFCLREDAGETPSADSFYRRFPEIATGLKRVLDIHDLIGSRPGNSMASISLRGRSNDATPFPDAGQTIAGFHLVEELGRGGFARVFLAKERQLADRLVALKVAKTGSREPQTLARLQHTHIVPVHSYRIDPATDLHLLCMPFFGRVTLAHLLGDPEVKEARLGAQLVEALDRLDPAGLATASARSVGRDALSCRPYARAVAWWGARLAEALQHAHDRGVLHRDVKPSNVLVTADGMPMLLDFNLAHEPMVSDDPEEIPPTLGGTVAYMSPEHLEALAEGRSDGVDTRSDIYSLGVVLFEAMGARPFEALPPSRSMREALLRAAEVRREVVRVRDQFPEIPAAMATVIETCMAAEPRDRYATAAHLAADLQSVADDLPLLHAREPIGVRVWSKVRRHHRAMAATTAVLVAVGMIVFGIVNSRWNADRELSNAIYQFDKALLAEKDGDYSVAEEGYNMVARGRESSVEKVREIARSASLRSKAVADAARTLKQVDDFFVEAEALRWTLLAFDQDRGESGPTLQTVLEPFYVFVNPNWTQLPELDILEDVRHRQLVSEVHELLYLGAIAAAGSDRRESWLSSQLICRKALSLNATLVATGDRESAATLPLGPWRALERYVAAKLDGRPVPRSSPPLPGSIESPWECYQWGRFVLMEERPDPRHAVDWLIRAAQKDNGRFWLEFDAAYQADRAGRFEAALEHYNAAIELRPDYARARANRARLERMKGAWSRSLEDLDQAIAADPELVEARLELGLVHQALGHPHEAIAAYERVIRHPDAGPLQRAARLNRAMALLTSGQTTEARSALDEMIGLDPDDESARLGRAQLLMREGELDAARSDLDSALRTKPVDTEVLALRSMVALMQGRPQDALADAMEAYHLDPSSRFDRLVVRCRLATGTGAVPRLDDPADLRALPLGDDRLVADLKVAADRLAHAELSPSSRSTLAVVLASLGRHRDAEREASQALADAPLSTRAWRVRARLRADRGEPRKAMGDVIRGLEIEPDDARLLELRGVLRLALGDPVLAMEDIDRALRLGAGPSAYRVRAQALTKLGEPREAVESWNRWIASEPNDAEALLGRAECFLANQRWEQAVADLEKAASLAGNRRGLLAQITTTYLQTLPQEPKRWPRALKLAMRAIGW